MGFVVGLAAGGAFRGSCAAIAEAPFGCAEFFLFRYQTLAAGGLALIGAWLLWVQIQDQRRQALEIKKQAEIAARIRIPHALAQLSVYWKHCYDAWAASDLSLKTMAPPYEAIETIMAAGPLADPETFVSIKKLTIQSQAFEARLTPLRNAELGTRQRLGLMIVDIARLNYYADPLYAYGRMETPCASYVPSTRETLQQHLDRYVPYRRDTATRTILRRMDQAFDSQFGRRPGAEAQDEEDDFETLE
ncbi:hypothetical protein [Rhizobium sp. S152]|uniref:hypothetical protein n=1 Tax=Rhizobium sp. S152 TaxID=3055038 RepID=UPI0025A9599A|nr:hypothetical protein [Rhizobium sp. S152]